MFLRKIEIFDLVTPVLIELDPFATGQALLVGLPDDFDDAGKARKTGRDFAGKIDQALRQLIDMIELKFSNVRSSSEIFTE